jgi:hypothetical protein
MDTITQPAPAAASLEYDWRDIVEARVTRNGVLVATLWVHWDGSSQWSYTTTAGQERGRFVDQDAAKFALEEEFRDGEPVAAPDEIRDVHMIFVYYSRASRDQQGDAGPSSELFDTAYSEAQAIEKAAAAARQHPQHEFAVEGGRWEPGGWENPVFKNGERIR